MERWSSRCASVIYALALFLAGCVLSEELRREDEAACSGYGFHAGTDALPPASSGKTSAAAL